MPLFSVQYREANIKVHRRGLELIKGGVRCSEIAAELNDLFSSLGLLRYRSFGYGHSFGVLSHYYGREADLELREDVDTVLQPGMVVSMVVLKYFYYFFFKLYKISGAHDHHP